MKKLAKAKEGHRKEGSANETSVVNLRTEAYDVYIGRPSKWGNPFTHLAGTLGTTRVPTRDDAIRSYEEWLRRQPDLLADLQELVGKRLGCYCNPRPCHGDVLARAAQAAEATQ